MHNRALYLIGLGMLMFAGGVAVVITARDTATHVLGGIACLGALAVVIANYDRPNGKDHH